MSLFSRTPRVVVVVAAVLAFTLGAAGAVMAARIGQTGGAVSAVSVATAFDPYGTDSTTPLDVPAMWQTVNVPANQHALLLITFSAETRCYTINSASDPSCYIRVLVDGQVAQPGSVVFDSGDDASASTSMETNAMQFTFGPVGAGNHTVRVQFSAGPSITDFVLGARTLTVLRSSL